MLACPRCVIAVREGDTCPSCQGIAEEIDARPEIEATFDTVASALKDWRNRQAGVQRMERFRVLPNQTLVHLAAKRPTTQEALLRIPGIGPAKARDYVLRLEELAGAYVSCIGVGPGRDQTIVRRDVLRARP